MERDNPLQPSLAGRPTHEDEIPGYWVERLRASVGFAGANFTTVAVCCLQICHDLVHQYYDLTADAYFEEQAMTLHTDFYRVIQPLHDLAMFPEAAALRVIEQLDAWAESPARVVLVARALVTAIELVGPDQLEDPFRLAGPLTVRPGTPFPTGTKVLYQRLRSPRSTSRVKHLSNRIDQIEGLRIGGYEFEHVMGRLEFVDCERATGSWGKPPHPITCANCRTRASGFRFATAVLNATDDELGFGESIDPKLPRFFGPKIADLEVQERRIRSLVKLAHEQGVTILVFPELSTTPELAELLSDAVSGPLKIVVAGSFHHLTPEGPVNVALTWLAGHSEPLEHHKVVPMIFRPRPPAPPSAGVPEREFVEGITDHPLISTVFSVRGHLTHNVRLAFGICRDLIEGRLVSALVELRPDVVLAPAASPRFAPFIAAAAWFAVQAQAHTVVANGPVEWAGEGRTSGVAAFGHPGEDLIATRWPTANHPRVGPVSGQEPAPQPDEFRPGLVIYDAAHHCIGFHSAEEGRSVLPIAREMRFDIVDS